LSFSSEGMLFLRWLSCLGLAACAGSSSSVADESCITTATESDGKPPSQAALLQTMSVREKNNTTVASTLAVEDRSNKTAHAFMSLVAGKAKPHRGGAQAARASLSEAGYREIAALKDQDEMAAFVTRVAEELGYEITSPGKLNGAVPYYSGHKAKQSFKALSAEIVKTAGWSKPAHPSSVLASIEADVDEKEEEVDEDKQEEVEEEKEEKSTPRESSPARKEEKSTPRESSPARKASLSARKASQQPHGKSGPKRAKKGRSLVKEPKEPVPYSRPMSTIS